MHKLSSLEDFVSAHDVGARDLRLLALIVGLNRVCKLEKAKAQKLNKGKPTHEHQFSMLGAEAHALLQDLKEAFGSEYTQQEIEYIKDFT